MDINETRRCNQWNLERLARYLGEPPDCFEAYYRELLADQDLLLAINQQITRVRDDFGYAKGIFRQSELPTVDWFAFERILLYVVVRHYRPEHCLETGVFYGGNTLFLLAALHHNGAGRLTSIDLPASQMSTEESVDRHPGVQDSELYRYDLAPGFIIPEDLKPRWDFIEGNSLTEIPRLAKTFQLFIHDSEHAHDFMLRELQLATPLLSDDAIVIADDVDWSNGFFAYCVDQRLLPLLLTDNGKDNLRVRIGLAKRDLAANSTPHATGTRPPSH